MSSQGPSNPSTTSQNSSVGSESWSNTDGVFTHDGDYAEAIDFASSSPDTYYLVASNFGFSVPTGATIDGILFEIERSAGGSVVDNSVKLLIGGSLGSTDKASGSAWPGLNAYASYGGADDTWSASLSPANVNASNFGVAISADLGMEAVATIEHIRCTIYYTEGGVADTTSMFQMF